MRAVIDEDDFVGQAGHIEDGRGRSMEIGADSDSLWAGTTMEIMILFLARI
ncbi:MAG: hypothetical protein BroJett014_31970 [Planctomycetota bacterium]|nr:MAG: hypothetical protein BroJett014_31970 [Planctomycetota bacterium]